MNNILLKILMFVISVFAMTAIKAEPLIDCITINKDFAHIKQLIGSGELRYRTSSSKEQLPFDYQAKSSFTDYVIAARQYILKHNPQAVRPCPIISPTAELLQQQKVAGVNLQVVDLIAPFELKQKDSKKAILLIHGLTDSPYLFHDLAAFFYQQGFSVRTLLLPGHGTVAADLIDVDVVDWRRASHYAIEQALKDFQEVYLGGFSTGGALILDDLLTHHSIEAANKLKGVLLWSPASKAKSDLAWLAKYIDYIPFFDWLDQEADIDFAKYESFPINAGAQVNQLMEQLSNNLAKYKKALNIPLLVVAGQHDQTINTQATIELLSLWHQKISAQKKQDDTLVYYGELTSKERKLLDGIKIITPECVGENLCKEVLNIAHTAVTNAPENLHYGQDGSYRNCSHYLKDDKQYQLCKTASLVVKGERTAENLEQDLPLQRLTYNPYYQEMLMSIKQFIAKTSK